LNEPIRKKYNIRLRSFQNHYDLPIRLYKLHGSIDMYSFNLAYPKPDYTRIKSDYGVQEYYKEIYNKKLDSFEYKFGMTEMFPDFLSGTTEKIRNYNDPYYEVLFNHFKNNLKEAEKLIIVGYGFWDKGINEILMNNFISKGIEPIVIDPFKSKSEFYSTHSFNHILKSISDVSFDEFKSI